jgi:hypothetical protein
MKKHFRILGTISIIISILFFKDPDTSFKLYVLGMLALIYSKLI